LSICNDEPTRAVGARRCASKRGDGCWAAVTRTDAASVSRSRDDGAVRKHEPNPKIFVVGDPEPAPAIHSDAGRPAQLGSRCVTSIASKPRKTIAGNDSGTSINGCDPQNKACIKIYNHDGPIDIHSKPVRKRENRLRCRPAI